MHRPALPGDSLGPDNELGTVNFITPEVIRAAVQCVRRGVVFNLDCSINAINPPAGARELARHSIIPAGPNALDDYVDAFYLQGTSQIDGLRHIWHTEHGFYNDTPRENLVPDTPSLGIQRWAESGIVGRGVLVDVERHLSRHGRQLDYRTEETFSVEVVIEAAAEQGVEFQHGDILLLRTGWLHFYFEEMTEEERNEFPNDIRCPGLLQSRETLAWIWDNRFSLVAADNCALESWPPDQASSPFSSEPWGIMHSDLIALLGLAVGELFALDELAADCAEDGVYEMMVVCKPLNLVGGVGSPPNGVAIK